MYPPNLNHQKDSLQLLEKLEAGKTFNNVRVLSKYFSTPADSQNFDQNSKIVIFKNDENSIDPICPVSGICVYPASAQKAFEKT